MPAATTLIGPSRVRSTASRAGTGTPTPTPTQRGCRTRRPGQRGTAAIWALLVTAGAFTVLLGLVVDGGRVIDARLDSAQTARQAARAAADELSQASVRSGNDDVAVSAATARAHTYLRHAGHQGTVQVQGDRVTVTVTGTSRTEVLNVIGVDAFPVRETASARAVTEETTR